MSLEYNFIAITYFQYPTEKWFGEYLPNAKDHAEHCRRHNKIETAFSSPGSSQFSQRYRIPIKGMAAK